MLDLTPDELLTTTRAVRRRLDLTRPVERSLVEECLDVALQAPNGGNRQRWRWIFVDDADTNARLANVYRTALVEYSQRPRVPRPDGAGGTTSGGTARPAPPPDPGFARTAESVMYLHEHMHEVPVLLVPVQRGRTEDLDLFAEATYWASIIPPIWSFMLALRARGLGSAWTTLTLQRETDVAEILGIPAGHTHAGLFPVAHTVGTDFRPAPREPAAGVMSWNGWA
jgi:nitroreductase